MSSIKNILYFQAGLGVLANMFLLTFYIFTIPCHSPKPVDLISCQLTFIHIIMVLTGWDIWLTDMFELLNIENDFKCKATFYISRVMRCLSICTSCLLSVFQAVTISPSTSLLAKFKQRLKITLTGGAGVVTTKRPRCPGAKRKIQNCLRKPGH